MCCLTDTFCKPQVNTAASSPAAEASGRAGGSSHATFQHSMSAGFINAPPRLWNINPPTQDQRKRSSSAYQVLLLFRFLCLVLALAFLDTSCRCPMTPARCLVCCVVVQLALRDTSPAKHLVTCDNADHSCRSACCCYAHCNVAWQLEHLRFVQALTMVWAPIVVVPPCCPSIAVETGAKIAV